MACPAYCFWTPPASFLPRLAVGYTGAPHSLLKACSSHPWLAKKERFFPAPPGHGRGHLRPRCPPLPSPAPEGWAAPGSILSLPFQLPFQIQALQRLRWVWAGRRCEGRQQDASRLRSPPGRSEGGEKNPQHPPARVPAADKEPFITWRARSRALQSPLPCLFIPLSRSEQGKHTCLRS